jgi:ABC-type antimicrobial peptide transport system permease subunit
MQDYLNKAAATRRFTLTILAAFALAAILLAASGLYAVVAYAAAQRTREIGVRVALGAQPSQVGAMVLRHGLGMVAAGVLLGIAGWFAASRYLAALLFGVSRNDPGTLLSAALLMAIAAGIATWMPVRRAISVDPLVALRSE